MTDKDLQKIKEYLVDITTNTDNGDVHVAVRNIKSILEKVKPITSKQSLQEQVNSAEIQALDNYCDNNNICVRDYVNADVMGELDYQSYVLNYYELHGECFECEQTPCDEGCPYQVNREKETNK
jgi:hypothetical protein